MSERPQLSGNSPEKGSQKPSESGIFHSLRSGFRVLLGSILRTKKENLDKPPQLAAEPEAEFTPPQGNERFKKRIMHTVDSSGNWRILPSYEPESPVVIASRRGNAMLDQYAHILEKQDVAFSTLIVINANLTNAITELESIEGCNPELIRNLKQLRTAIKLEIEKIKNNPGGDA